jgi:GDP-L-fucose synthase
MKILILGSNGLVGSAVSNLLNSKENLKIMDPNRQELNLFNSDEIKKFLSANKPDVVINCAAKVGGIVANNTHRVDFLLENLKINLFILENIINSSVKKMINLGSSCIYPLNAPNPITEESFLDGKLEKTNSPYAIAKIAAIELGFEISRSMDIEIQNLMPTNLYGPNDNFDPISSHVIPGLIYKFDKAKSENSDFVELWGTGKPLREFLYVDDLADAIYFLLDKKVEDKIINVGSGEEVSIEELASLVKNIVSFKGEIIFNTEYPDGNPRKLLNSQKITDLGWSPATSLESGLSRTYNWFKTNY